MWHQSTSVIIPVGLALILVMFCTWMIWQQPRASNPLSSSSNDSNTVRLLVGLLIIALLSVGAFILFIFL
ncbi:MAG: hypothetical protein KC441_15180 [Anaerolineales bacterium]|nr:hypothetical protein [Anaerolineales bacterium]